MRGCPNDCWYDEHRALPDHGRSDARGCRHHSCFAEYPERRRAREERERERDRLTEERVKWLRQERRQSYAALIDAGYQAANLYLEASSRLFEGNDPDGATELWRRRYGKTRPAHRT